MTRARAVIDLAAVRTNLEAVRELAGDAQVMAVVKADAYGHGLLPMARAARNSGAEWLGVALPSEALQLRADGDQGRILAWLWSPRDADVDACIAAGVDLSVSSAWALAEVITSARQQGVTARVQVKLDTGLSRNGVSLEEWPDLMTSLAGACAEGAIKLEAIWSHLADADLPGASTVVRQRERFVEAVDRARAAGLSPALLHLSNSGGLWAFPDCRFDLVRTGIAMYGLTPAPHLGSAAELGLTPVMTLRAELAHVKRVSAGTSVSYGSTWTTPVDTVLGLVPVGYADGIPRASGGRVVVSIGGRLVPAVGRTAMDQFVVDLGPGSAAEPGDDVYLFGSGGHGELTADEWAERIDTIGYELVTRLGSRIPREYVDESAGGTRQDGT